MSDQPCLAVQLPLGRLLSGGKLVLGHCCPRTDGAPSALAHNPQRVLAISCAGGQIQREILLSGSPLRVKVPSSKLPAEG